MKHALSTLAVAACFVFAGAASAQTDKAGAKAEKERIEADYKASKDRCGQWKDNAQDIGKVEAKGKYKVAKAEMEAKTEPSPRHDAKVRTEKADAAYQLAKEKCDDMKGDAKNSCQKDAKAAFASAKAEANKVKKR